MMPYMRSNSGHISFVVRGRPTERVAGALEVARRRIARIRHPDEPDEPFASFISEVRAFGEGWTFAVDMADAEAYDDILERTLACLVGALEETDVESAEVSFPEDAETGVDTGGPPAEASEPEGVPVERPAGFPLPPGSRLVADTTLGGRRVSEFLIDEPIQNLLAFYRSGLEADGYEIQEVIEDCPPDMFKARHFVGFHKGELRGALLLTEWLEFSPALGFGDVRIDTWKDR